MCLLLKRIQGMTINISVHVVLFYQEDTAQIVCKFFATIQFWWDLAKNNVAVDPKWSTNPIHSSRLIFFHFCRKKYLVVLCSILNMEIRNPVEERSLSLILGKAGLKVINIDLQTLGYICEVAHPSITTNLLDTSFDLLGKASCRMRKVDRDQ